MRPLRQFLRRFPFDKATLKKNWLALSAGAFLCFAALFALWAGSLKIPDLGTFEERRVENSTKIYDRTGKILLYDVHQNIKRTVVPYSDMGANIKNATVAIEDRDFYEHGGVRFRSVARAILVNLRLWPGYAGQGGSTITQQVIKNALLTKEKKISRKVKEWILATKLEQTMSKEDILNLYLNESPYGGPVYGIGEAANYYFGKLPSELTIAEAAYLAALPQAPTYYSPYGKHKDELERRKNLVLTKMRELNFITDEEYRTASDEVVVFLPQNEGNAKALHFVMWVREYLTEMYGEEALLSGLKVTTTLDYNLQKKAEEVVRAGALENEKKFNAKNAAMVAIDPKTGHVLVMVGSRDYLDKEIQGSFNVALAHRQPGSSFKPIVYATAFMKGYTPDTILFDLPTEFQTTCTPEGAPLPGMEDDCYMPVNYDGKYHGPITLRNALAQSVNIPALKLLYLAGLDDSLRTARVLGVKSLKDKDQYGLTLVLGGGEVSLLDLTSAYSVFANNGVRNPYASVLKIQDGDGRVLEEWKPRSEEVIRKDIALTINDILSDNAARAPAFGVRSALTIPGREVAVKTGTTNDYRDAWVLGYTPSLAVGAWAGNNDNTSMQKNVAGFIIAPLWNAFIIEALKEYPVEQFEKPNKKTDWSLKPVFRGVWWGGKNYIIDNISGKLATPLTPDETKGEVVIRDPHSILYWVDKKNPLGPAPLNPEQDPQFKLWEVPVQKWVAAQASIPGIIEAEAPQSYDDVHGPNSLLTLSIKEPYQNQAFNKGAIVLVKVENFGRFPIVKMDLFLNNNFIGSASSGSYSFVLNEYVLAGRNELKIIGYDSVSNRAEMSTEFMVNGN